MASQNPGYRYLQHRILYTPSTNTLPLTLLYPGSGCQRERYQVLKVLLWSDSVIVSLSQSMSIIFKQPYMYHAQMLKIITG